MTFTCKFKTSGKILRYFDSNEALSKLRVLKMNIQILELPKYFHQKS